MAMSTQPLTVQRLTEMKEQFDKDFPPSKFDKGADMNQRTFDVLTRTLGISLYSKDNGLTWFDPHKIPFIGVPIHIVPSIPFGEVEPCRCAERGFHKTEGMEFTQTLSIEEVKRRYPDAKIPGETE